MWLGLSFFWNPKCFFLNYSFVVSGIHVLLLALLVYWVQRNVTSSIHIRKTIPVALEDMQHLIIVLIFKNFQIWWKKSQRWKNIANRKLINILNVLAELKVAREKHQEQIAKICSTVKNLKKDLFSQVTQQVEQRSNQTQNPIFGYRTKEKNINEKFLH